jgi:hypothetical protein
MYASEPVCGNSAPSTNPSFELLDADPLDDEEPQPDNARVSAATAAVAHIRVRFIDLRDDVDGVDDVEYRMIVSSLPC